ncbi:hypothetical protein EVAR_13613_1 [Eumeta japonica]|uniref:Uncharacterized protein n=1 Tax=Eumeta variegata TaxID=151549 RepID=A0A4C1UTZ2_EUMVA|nr:hypothetical protein EVAR_13613_1 [Eumeta japonica]
MSRSRIEADSGPGIEIRSDTRTRNENDIKFSIRPMPLSGNPRIKIHIGRFHNGSPASGLDFTPRASFPKAAPDMDTLGGSLISTTSIPTTLLSDSSEISRNPYKYLPSDIAHNNGTNFWKR